MNRIFSALLCFTAAFACLAPVAQASGDTFAVGRYVLTGVREMGAELVLGADGQFEYMLAYGAYDEYARGTWQFRDGKVLLNSVGADIPPAFKLQESAHRPEPVIGVQVLSQDGKGLAGIDVTIDFDGQTRRTGYTQSYGLNVPWEKAAAPRGIALAIDMYGVEPQWFKDLPPAHNQYVFVFEPGSLGQARFRDAPFDWDGTALTTVRNGQRLRFERH